MSTLPRFPGTPNTENTDRASKRGYQKPAYAATLTVAVDPADTYTLIDMGATGTLTGALTVNVNVGSASTPPFVGDTLRFLFASDGTSRVVTFITGFLPNGTLSVTTTKFAIVTFIFIGSAWAEQGRTVTS